ncbi:type II secretion system minor pseudopilin GspH [Ferrimonas gelatinilytica]|uniref:Type II secretion system protein H n=1 Tax=Ferrimonas gelatinilytica TaxID=1255257 RepID=A0ABP9SBI4_9GAMM
MSGVQPFSSVKAPRQRGFTLLEMLLVVLLIGVMAGSVSLIFGGDARREAMIKSGDEFRVVVSTALEEAALSGELVGVVVEPDHYFFARWNLDDEAWEEHRGDRLYRQRTLPEGIEMTLELEGLPLVQEDEEEASEFGLDESLFEPDEEEKRKRPDPQLLLLPSGEMTAFVLEFDAIGGERIEGVDLVGDMLGRIAWRHDLEAQ